MSAELCDVSGCSCDLSGNPTMSPVPEELDEQSRVEAAWGLRLRTRIQELTEDLSSNLIILRPLTRPPSFEQLATATPKLNLNDLYLQGVFCFLRFLTLSAQALQVLWNLCANIGKGVKKTFQEEQVVFFRGSCYPYRLSEIHLNAPGVPEIEWYYNSTSNTFVSARLYNNSAHYATHHIPYLTAEVKYNDLVLYDISDFINRVRWAGEDGEGMPNVDHLVSAWTLSSGIVLQRSPAMNLAVINTDGDEVRLPLRHEA